MFTWAHYGHDQQVVTRYIIICTRADGPPARRTIEILARIHTATIPTRSLKYIRVVICVNRACVRVYVGSGHAHTRWIYGLVIADSLDRGSDFYFFFCQFLLPLFALYARARVNTDTYIQTYKRTQCTVSQLRINGFDSKLKYYPQFHCTYRLYMRYLYTVTSWFVNTEHRVHCTQTPIYKQVQTTKDEGFTCVCVWVKCTIILV